MEQALLAAPRSRLFGPVFCLGAVLLSAGTLGLLILVSLELWRQVPSEVWVCFGMVTVGLAFASADVLQRALHSGTLHESVCSYVAAWSQFFQRMWLLTVLESPSLEDVQRIISHVSPVCAEILGAPDALTAYHILRAGVNGQDPHSAAAAAAAQDGGSAQPPDPDLAVAMAWLRRKNLVLGFDEQLHLYGLAKQAASGDCTLPEASSLQPLEREKRRCWELQRGLSRTDATRQLLHRLAELDPGFRASQPRLARAADAQRQPLGSQNLYSAVEMVQLISELVESRAPTNLDEIVVQGRRKVLSTVVALGVLRLLWRAFLSKAVRRLLERARAARAGTWFALAGTGYLLLLNVGLPASVHACLPFAPRTVPARVERMMRARIGEPVPRLCRWVVAALTPPVRDSIFN